VFSTETSRYDAVLTQVIEILSDITSDWDLDLSGGITEESRLVGDLGFESLDVVMLLVSLEERFQADELPFNQLLYVDDALVEDVSARDLSIFLCRHVERRESR
jgi:acyl carrier protein